VFSGTQDRGYSLILSSAEPDLLYVSPARPLRWILASRTRMRVCADTYPAEDPRAHSCLRALTGSTRVARQAGIRLAPAATVIRIMTTLPIVTES